MLGGWKEEKGLGGGRLYSLIRRTFVEYQICIFDQMVNA